MKTKVPLQIEPLKIKSKIELYDNLF